LAHHLPFGLRQLRYDQIVLGLPFKQAGASLSFSSTGFDLHRELGWRLALGFSRRSLSLGAGLNLLSLAQRGVPSRRFLAPTAGLLFKPSPQLQLATWWQKATPISSSRFFVSITRHLDAHSSRYLHSCRYPTRPTRFDLAAVHRLHPRLKLRLGLRSVPRAALPLALALVWSAYGWTMALSLTLTWAHRIPSTWQTLVDRPERS